MPDLTIRDVPQDELDDLTARGARHGRSAEEEVRHLIHEAAAEQRIVSELERVTRAAAVGQTVSPARPGAAPPAYRRRKGHEPTPRRG
jgi:plasmid stability protein